MGNNKRKNIYYFISLVCLLLIPSFTVNAETFMYNVKAVINGIYSYEDDRYDELTQYNVVQSTYPNNETSMRVTAEVYDNTANNYIIVTTYCTTFGPYSANATTPGYDSTNSNIIANYSVTDTSTKCSVSGYEGYLHQSVVALAKNNNVYSFTFTIWTGVSVDYDVLTQINNISIYPYTEDLAQQFIENQKNQIIIEQNNITNEKLDKINSELSETNDYLKDDTEPNADISALGNVQGLLPAGPVDSLLNIPFMFLSVLTSSMGGVCVPMEFTFVFDSKLTLPCFSEQFYNNVPEILLNFLSLIPGAWILIKYFKHLYLKVERAVSMDSNADDQWGVI